MKQTLGKHGFTVWLTAVLTVVVLAVAVLFFGTSSLQAQDTAGSHTLKLENADIGNLIATVAEITGRNFVIDPRVTGNVTVISSQPMDAAAIYQAFLSILEVHGYAAIESGDVTRIVPGVQALQSGPPGIADDGSSLVTRIVPVRHVTATDLVPLLRPLVAANAHVIAHPASNSLLIADRAANVQRLEQLIARIDRAADTDVEVIPLQHANAAELARTLAQLYPSAQGAQTVVADERTNTLLLTGDPSQRLRVRALISHLDTPLESGGSTNVIYLSYADAEELVPILQESVKQPGSPDNAGAANIQAHGETNALVITAPPAVFRSLQSVVRQLDIRRQQVHVEAVIAEVSLESMKELGIQWQIFDNFGEGEEGIFGGTNFATGGNNILGLAGGIGGENGVLPGNGLNVGYISGTTSILGTEVLEIGALVRALASDTDTNVLSTPSVVSLDNSEAEIYVGQEVPFLTGQFTNTGLSDQSGVVNPFQTISRDEVGIRLSVTPHINEGDSVILDIEQEISAIAPITGAVDLITNKRTLRTSVMVPDNAILVLGGLITDDLREIVDKVPGLSKIPGLGELFKYRNTQKVKRNLMVFIRPRILRDAATEANLSGGKYRFIRAEQIKARERADGLTPKDQMPLLPELFDYLQAPLPEGAVPNAGNESR